MILRSHEDRLRHEELVLEKTDLSSLSAMDFTCNLPEGYHFVFFRPGDEIDWIRIEMSAKEIRDETEGDAVFHKYYGGYEERLCDRMLFVKDPYGQKVATVTAWWDIRKEESHEDLMLHWFAVAESAQGMGLARPLLSRALLLMRDLGARRIVIPTQTTTWLACRLYLDFGFTPIPQNLIRSELGWRMIRRLTDHPALSSLTPATLPEMFPELFRTDQHPEEVQEHSCGCMVLGKQKEQTQCLLLLSNKNEWGFPKGHVEIGEHERDTALRELWEETGLRANLVPHFRRETIYLTDTVGKRVTYFLAAADPRVPIHIQDTEEIREACWLEPEDALDRLIREDRRELLSQALTYWAGVTR